MTEPLAPPPFDPEAAAAAAERFAAAAEPDVAYALHDTPVGRVVLAATRRGLVRVAYEDFNGGEDEVVDDLARRVSPRVLRAPARLDEVRRELDEFFAGERRAFDVALDWSLVQGFGRKVLQATARIPFGETGSYASVAAGAGSPKAVRAAGTALGRNPMPIVVPCHRVLRSGGALGGYTGGVQRKVTLLTVEGVLPA
ncbi:methylated-DNA--[protein]-cysteine S-methyltransferase [Conexibacter sp. SYSU D00693]|uniref:methylated-DNA--[protein]-cysteine S-methyltransferase n=1 Tax=Conexibacter sp. SYSU D00693 TaxID=2812560 RepID=UPI00196B4A2A|nr:methylated-DNA--[protein]-cysteine S-methyltransferase [Conexibacter sp. SYSU D00693]